MNKKILSIFALIMAISILGISCADNNTTDPTTTTTPIITEAKALDMVKAIGDIAPNSSSFKLSEVTEVTASGADYKATVDDATSDVTVDIPTLLKAITDKETQMNSAGGVVVNVEGIDFKIAEDTKSVDVTIPYTKDSKTANIIITFTLSNASGSNAKFELKGISKAEVEGALKTAIGKIAINTTDTADGVKADFTAGGVSLTTGTIAATLTAHTVAGSLSEATKNLQANLKAAATTLSDANISITNTPEFTGKSGEATTATATITIAPAKGYELTTDTNLTGADITVEIKLNNSSTDTWA